MSFIASDVAYSVPDRVLLDRLSLRLEAGQVHALLGPNGAGKSTLLRLMSGELTPDRGNIELNGRALPFWSARDQARQRAVLPQAHGLAFGFTAGEVVALGRLPCARHGAADEARLVHEALALAGVPHLADRTYTTLSGGERARVQLARVVAQVWEPLAGSLAGRPRFLLLDEPTASLDFAHQHDCLRAVRVLATLGLGVLVILHDPNLALRYADAVTLLREGSVIGSGRPAEVIRAEALERLYRVPVKVVTVEGQPMVVAAGGPGR
jgi:iron complex transport system ATP-binding protein